mmetsp:Transcript_6834/g.15773  ORF Transcript_6834/g.15773 Transcript_6834/m.15773 type:complete len:144 (+) Transcript_6834:46-477(+)
MVEAVAICETEPPGAPPEVACAESDWCCPVCFDKLESHNLAFLDCSHSFCLDCVVEWCNTKSTCPQCRTLISHISCHRRLDGTKTEHLVQESLVLMLRASWLSCNSKHLQDVEDDEDFWDCDDSYDEYWGSEPSERVRWRGRH